MHFYVIFAIVLIMFLNKMRNEKIDLCKGILIWLVVLGHLLELVIKVPAARGLYVLIYTFHMPLFVFTTGYFAKFNLKKIFLNILYPYILFSVLYQICALWLWKDINKVMLITPYWLLWYLFATFVWSISLPLWERIKEHNRMIFLGISVFVACFAGFFTQIGRAWSLSRILVFFPFFVLGKYWHHYEKRQGRPITVSSNVKVALGIIFLVVCAVIILFQKDIRYTWLYEATSYAAGKYHVGIRLGHILLAGFGVCFLMFLLQDKKFAFFQRAGRDTMPVFLLHGFLIKCFKSMDIAGRLGLEHKEIAAVMICIIAAAVIVWLLSTRVVCRMCRLLTAPWSIWKK